MSEALEQWCWSWDGEHFIGGPEDSREGAIAAAKVEVEGTNRKIYVGQKQNYLAFNFDLVEHLCEQEQCEADDQVGEVADSWPGVLELEKVMEANEKIKAIMRELVGEPHFYGITKIEEVDR